MLQNLTLILFLLTSFTTLNSYALEPDPVAISQEDYHSLRNKIITSYSELSEKEDRTLRVPDRWNSKKLEAVAERWYRAQVVIVSGAMARHPLITFHGLAALFCHEAGHHFAGAPFKPKYKTYWASAEGQADYFVGTRCFHRIFSRKDNLAWYKKYVEFIRKDFKYICTQAHKQSYKYVNCIRNLYAGLSLSRFFNRKLKNTPQPKIDTPDTTVVNKTNWQHPLPQCRLDTFLSASICINEVDNSPPATLSTDTYCYREQHEYGYRPLCWFKP